MQKLRISVGYLSPGVRLQPTQWMEDRLEIVGNSPKIGGLRISPIIFYFENCISFMILLCLSVRSRRK